MARSADEPTMPVVHWTTRIRVIVTLRLGEPLNATTRVDGSTSTTSGPTQRTPTVPRRWPAVSSQFGTPGSRWAITNRTLPSSSSCAEWQLSVDWWCT